MDKWTNGQMDKRKKTLKRGKQTEDNVFRHQYFWHLT